jgi:hypothetical protein
MANEYYISAGLIPIDNSSGATANSYYISAGLVPVDTALGGDTEYFPYSGQLHQPDSNYQPTIVSV